MIEFQKLFVRDLHLNDSVASYHDLTALANSCMEPLSGLTFDMASISDKELAKSLSSIVDALGGKVIQIQEPNYKFAVWSDIHLYQRNSPDDTGKGRGRIDFKNALSIAQNYGVKLAGVCGDIGFQRSYREYTKAYYQDAVASIEHDFPISCCTGNHDQYLAEDEWYATTSCCASSYYENISGDTFFFLSLKNLYASSATGYGNGCQDEPYAQADIDLLSSVLSANADKRTFLFMHFPLNAERTICQYPGLGQENYGGQDCVYTVDDDSNDQDERNRIYNYGFKLSADTYKNAQNELILNMLKVCPGTVVVFNGHSHYEFDVDRTIPNVNYMEIFPNKHVFHAPSLNFPRNRSSKTIADGQEENQPSQGYIVNVYDDQLIVNGYEFNPNLTNNNPMGELRRTFIVK